MLLFIGDDWAEDHVRHEALKSGGGERPSPLGRRSSRRSWGSLIRETPVRVGAALTTPGRASTARWCGSGEQDGKVYVRNQCSTPLNAHQLKSGGFGLVAVRTLCLRAVGELRSVMSPPGGHGEGLRRNRGDAAGAELGASPVDRLQ